MGPFFEMISRFGAMYRAVYRHVVDCINSLGGGPVGTNVAELFSGHGRRQVMFKLELGNPSVGSTTKIAIDGVGTTGGRRIAKKYQQALDRLYDHLTGGGPGKSEASFLEAFKVCSHLIVVLI